MLVNSSAPTMGPALAMRETDRDVPPDAPALYRPAQLALCRPTQKGAWTRTRAGADNVVATAWGARAHGMDAQDRGLTMERACVACDGSGLAEHVDRTLPPPPCRLCHPEEAALHVTLARESARLLPCVLEMAIRCCGLPSAR